MYYIVCVCFCLWNLIYWFYCFEGSGIKYYILELQVESGEAENVFCTSLLRRRFDTKDFIQLLEHEVSCDMSQVA